MYIYIIYIYTYNIHTYKCRWNVSLKPIQSVLKSSLTPCVVQAAPVLDDEEDEGVEAPVWVGAPDGSQLGIGAWLGAKEHFRIHGEL